MASKCAHLNVAPLPFTGQKRMFLNEYKQVLQEWMGESEGEGRTIVDAFGGSGLLAHTAKRCYPKARVIYNDFDGYSEKLAHIEDYNRLRRILAHILRQTPSKKKLDKQTHKQVLQAISDFDGTLNKDVLASWLVFSGKQLRDVGELFNQSTLYNCVRKTDYPSAQGYLHGLEVVKLSYDVLIPQFRADKNALLVLDPPYLCTHMATYNLENYFDLIDFMRLMDNLRPPFMLFSSTKSECVRFVD